MAITLEELKAAFKQDQSGGITRRESWGEDGQADKGYQLSQLWNVRLTHYEYPGRNERLEVVLLLLFANNTLTIYDIQHLWALHDHKGHLRAELSRWAGHKTRWLNALEDAWNACCEDGVTIYQGDHWFEKVPCGEPPSFYDHIRYEIPGVTDGHRIV